MSAFAKIAAAKATGGGNNIRDGIYRFVIEKFHEQKGHTGECIIAEFRVKAAEANNATDDAGRTVHPNSVGSCCSAVWNLTKHDAAAGNAKAFAEIAAQSMTGMSWGELVDMKVPGDAPGTMVPAFPGGQEQVLAWLAGPENPLRGVEIVDETYQGINKGRNNEANRGKKLTLNKWRPVTQTPDQIDANRKWLDTTTASADTGVAAQPAASATPTSASAPATASASTASTTAGAATAPAQPSPALAALLRKK